ncbi:Mfa1 family fimbria major subunit [Porphyromonas levii]|uniref:Mfa1 family fimbria major subunit n=1 Tax=Porphyromonas levii TaxID=28114 RepID=UPI001B8C7F2D|nr:Mfa1 family fimbria major subunit [Porphyromonas levii]MBR8712366.1 Minor fimbrium subunit Mfa1 [Porphyromonas levii]MBR8714167.1 Minor fimbrium subunit Mfa1 [Porphyromonas levii]MBR8726709.1 Minor fimbrium subunit Mfa1 [Porphyromonas levii]MBR8730821.1 Minor fimbrium subunit Mfa1 [Porphyromonas levii]MBR8735014.1 Minor fimbrium subunit Mfa1 [Porphyromonas levii]
MKKFFSVGALALALIMGMSSCNKNQNDPQNNGTQGETDTYVGLMIKFPSPSGTTRALPGDYNENGEWTGQDKIVSAKVYIVTNDATVNSSSYDLTKFDVTGNVLTPNIVVKAKSGENVKAYVILNDRKGKLISQVDNLAPAEFATKFAEIVAEAATIQDIAETISDTSTGTGTDVKDIIVMTNDVAPENKQILPNATPDMAKSGTRNQMEVNVSRIASRGIVTAAQNIKTKKLEIKMSKTVEDKVNSTVTTEEATTATLTITDIEYNVSGGAKKVRAMKNILSAGDENGMKVVDEVYNFTPNANLTWENLYSNATASANFFFNNAPQEFKTVQESADKTTANVIEALKAEKANSRFVLPVTHADGNYKKGNTTMFEIRVKFTALNNTEKFPDAEDLSSHTGTVYYGVADGFFYTSKEKAQMKDKNFTGAVTTAKQEVKEYVNGYMYYYIWLNPNKPYSGTDKITMSPTVRNQVYHAHITGFKELGLSTKEEIKPDENLETDKTYLSVKLNVLPWTIHSYEVDLSNRY